MKKLCEHCNLPLESTAHGGRKYHVECARLVNLAKGKDRQRAFWAAKRAEKAKQQQAEESKPRVCWNCKRLSETPVCATCKALFKARNKSRRLEANKKPRPVDEPKPVGRDIPKGADQVMPYPVGGRSGLPRYQGV